MDALVGELELQLAKMKLGGGPMAGNELVGNLRTDKLVQFAGERGLETGISSVTLRKLEMDFRQLINS